MTLQKLRLFFIFYIGFIFIITAVFYFIMFDAATSIVVQDDVTENILYGFALLFSIAAVVMGNLLFNKFKKEAKVITHEQTQEQLYGKGSIIRLAMIEGALLYNIIIAFTFHLIPLLYLGATLLLYVLSLFPTMDRYKRDLNKYCI